jgi:galactokinase
MPDEYVFCVASSGIAAQKTGNAMRKYNRASTLCKCVLQTYNDATAGSRPSLADALSNGTGEQIRQVLTASRAKQYSAAELLNRFEHFYLESEEIIPAARKALAAGNVALFGTHVQRSQRIAEMLLGNQVSETIFLATKARILGAPAASAFGAGFGGSVWAMIETRKAPAFTEKWSQDYAKNFPQAAKHAEFIITPPGPAAFVF